MSFNPVRAAAITLLVLAARPVQAQNRYAATDAYADATPYFATQSIPELAAYLVRSGPDELTRARALYRWVTRHINYDAIGFRSGNYGDVTAVATLRKRTSVCEGYARLTQALGAAMGLQVEIVKGYAKGIGFTAGQLFDGHANHAWNAVRVNGQWRLMDATWGSGGLNEGQQFIRDFQDHYFLTAPADFIHDHLPEDPRWQLLDRAVTKTEFAAPSAGRSAASR
jgi:transglutaminase/protease-like cytokinesis protein 3